MIDWLKEKFEGLICVFAVLGIAGGTVFSGIAGNAVNDDAGFVIGCIIGFFVSVISVIISCGYMATVIHISDTNDEILRQIKNLNRNISSNQVDSKSNYSGTSEKEKKGFSLDKFLNEESKKENDSGIIGTDEDGYDIVKEDGKIFAMKDGKAYCRFCHAQIVYKGSVCWNCDKSTSE